MYIYIYNIHVYIYIYIYIPSQEMIPVPQGQILDEAICVSHKAHISLGKGMNRSILLLSIIK